MPKVLASSWFHSEQEGHLSTILCRGAIQMPTKAPSLLDIREEIAREAALLSGETAHHFLQLLGPAEITAADLDTDGWRLVYYQGTAVEHEIIEKAIALVHRRYPIATKKPAS